MDAQANLSLRCAHILLVLLCAGSDDCSALIEAIQSVQHHGGAGGWGDGGGGGRGVKTCKLNQITVMTLLLYLRLSIHYFIGNCIGDLLEI